MATLHREGGEAKQGDKEVERGIHAASSLERPRPLRCRPAYSQVSAAIGGLKFVNMSHPDDVRRHKCVQTEIRRHVMKDIGRQRRRPRSKETKTTPPVTRSFSQEIVRNEASLFRMGDANSSSPSRSLAPLGSFPIEGDMRVLELVRFANEATHFYLPFRAVWFEISLSDTGAFHVTLGNAAHWWGSVKVNDDLVNSPEVMKHYSLSLMHLRRRLNDVAESMTKGTIANILAHICLSARHHNWDSWRVHMHGLSLIWKARGGFADLGHRMNMIILLDDLTGAMIFDSFPQFPLPLDLPVPMRSVREVPARLQALLLTLQQKSHDLAPAVEALKMVSSVADVVNLNSHSPSFWQRDIDALTLIGPCLHFLLSMPRLPNNFSIESNSKDLIAREMVRLVCLILMSTLKERFSFLASERAALQSSFGRFVTLHSRSLGGEHHELKVWSLVTAAVLQGRGEREVYIREILRDVSAMDGLFANGMLEAAKETLWVDALESPFADNLAHDIMQQATLVNEAGL